METWLKISLLLSMFGFFKEIRPSEPFVFEYLSGEWRNITEEQVTQDVYPVGTYSYLLQLFIVFLITDLCRYKPLVVSLALSGIIVWSLLIWTTSLLDLQIAEAFYGTFMATEVAYYTYIYAKVSREYFQQVTSHTRAAILAGRAVSGLLAQALISFKYMDYKELNYITLAAQIVAALWSLLLPQVDKSIYFHPKSESINMIEETPRKIKIYQAFWLMKAHFVHSFSNRYVLKWSIWWILSTTGFIQVQTYMQPLWSTIQKEQSATLYNGLVESVLTILGFSGALAAGYLKVSWKKRGDLLVFVTTLICGGVLLITAYTGSIWVSYCCYIVFGGLYHFMVTVASSEIAKYIQEDSYGLVFGFTTFIALALQSVLTIVFVSKGVIGLGLSPPTQYLTYGLYHVIIGAIYLIKICFNCIVDNENY